MKKVIIPIIIAVLFWFVMFSPWTKNLVNFWITMGFAGSTLVLMSVIFGNDFKKQFSFNIKDIAIGIASAAVLYLVFLLGEYLATQWFDFARGQVDNIYAMKEGESKVFLSLLLLMLVGPAEEIFWRGYVQRLLGEKYGEWSAFFVTTIIYTLVHIWSLNFMLIMAAMVCGAFWGMLYKYNKNLVTLIISHAVWDVSVFILFPIL